MAMPAVALADVSVDKQISQIRRDSKYLWGESRAESEQEARDQALKNLTVKVTEYLNSNDNMPENVLMSRISSISDCLSTHSSRWHILVYVKKDDLIAINNNDGVLLTRTQDSNGYQQAVAAPIVEETVAEEIIEEPVPETIVEEKVEEPKVEVRPMSPTLSMIATTKNKEELQSTLTTLKKQGRVLGAALFPLSKANDYYVCVIDPNGNNIGLLHCLDGQWLNAYTNSPVDISTYVNCNGYWFTINE